MKSQDLQNGDLIFTASQSPMAEAIQSATGSYSHVAVFFDGLVYHATGENGVVKENVLEFLQGDQVYEVYAYPQIDLASVRKRAEEHLGKPYNVSFSPDSNAFYCSEYIADILPIFETIPMQFGNEKEDISPFWRDYFAQLGLPVPLDQPGTNPSQLAQSPALVYKGVLDD